MANSEMIAKSLRVKTQKLAVAIIFWTAVFSPAANAQTSGNLERVKTNSPAAIISAGDHVTASCGPTDRSPDHRAASEPVLMAHAGKGPLSGFGPAFPFPWPIPLIPSCIAVAGQTSTWGFGKTETGVFTTEFDATPDPNFVVDQYIGLSQNRVSQNPLTQSDFDQMAVTIRFNQMGYIEVRNGYIYTYNFATNVIEYTPGMQYHFLVYVDISQHRYTIQVTPAGGATQWLAIGADFRDTQSNVTSLNYWDVLTVSPQGTLTVCNFTLE